MPLLISIVALIVSLLVALVTYIKLKSVYVNLWNLSKGMDVLFENEKKILELTKIKGFVQLTNEEEQSVLKEVTEERSKLNGVKKRVVRSPDGDKNNEGS
jgi:hypothetical protein